MKRIAVKIGTRVLTDKGNRINRRVIKSLADQIAELMDSGIEIVVVSSGAIGAGLGLLKEVRKEKSLSELQAIASVGQTHLMDMYNAAFSKKGYIAGQILLTQEDFESRRRFLNIRYTLNTLLRYKAVPIINENDSVSTEEIKCGDNDRLSSLVADLADSDMLIILTDVEGLYNKEGHLIRVVDTVTEDLKSVCKGKACEESVGGMVTKLEAAKNAASAGIKCVIARGRKKNVLVDIVAGAKTGTYFHASKKPLRARKRWIAFSLKPKGSIFIDHGACAALLKKGKSLLPSGILGVSGFFSEGDVVEIVADQKRTVARGLSNYSSEEIKKIKGIKSGKIEEVLGYKDYDEVVHRDNLVIIDE